MEAVIPPALEALRTTGAPILHYKVCSTFNSSPTIGSFGRVMDIAQRVLGRTTIPIVVGAPKLARYSLFGTLFARHNVDGTVHRIDRHPTMSVHPTTPMREADMRRHIGAQTSQSIALLAAPAIGSPPAEAAVALDAALASNPDSLLIDIVDEVAEPKVGSLLERMATRRAPLFRAWLVRGRICARRRVADRGRVCLPMRRRCPRRRWTKSSSFPAVARLPQARRSRTRSGPEFEGVALDPVRLIKEGAAGPYAAEACRSHRRPAERGTQRHRP